jgi:hypothetical protein
MNLALIGTYYSLLRFFQAHAVNMIMAGSWVHLVWIFLSRPIYALGAIN